MDLCNRRCSNSNSKNNIRLGGYFWSTWEIQREWVCKTELLICNIAIRQIGSGSGVLNVLSCQSNTQLRSLSWKHWLLRKTYQLFKRKSYKKQGHRQFKRINNWSYFSSAILNSDFITTLCEFRCGLYCTVSSFYRAAGKNKLLDTIPSLQCILTMFVLSKKTQA